MKPKHYITRPATYNDLQAGQQILYNNYQRPAVVHIVETVCYARHDRKLKRGSWRGLEKAKNIRIVIAEMKGI
jgi:hypothetical protein